MKITLSKKIQGGFIFCCLILLVVAVLTFRNSEKFMTTNQWVNHTHEVLYELEQILISSVEAETGTRGFLITGNEEYLQPFTNSKATLNGHLDKAKGLTADNLDQSRNIATLEQLTQDHMTQLERYIALRRQDFDNAKDLMVIGESKRILTGIRNLIRDTRQVEQSLLLKREQESEADAQDFNVIFILLLCVIGLVLMLVYFIITVNLAALQRAERETADKNWILTGSGDLTQGMQGNKPIAELAQWIIHHLAVYLNAQIGAFYLTGEDNNTLELSGTYAVDKIKKDNQSAQIGEGLIGQVAMEKRTIRISDIPSDHFTINTGIGNVIPKNIIAVPVIFDQRLTGVIELGSVHDFNELQTRYLDIVADSIAISITSSQAREKMKALLEETQIQAEELEVQQEELRQANEGLHNKTDLLEKSEMELKTQQDELLLVNAELEEKAKLLETQKTVVEEAKIEIEHKAREVEVASKYKSEFLANMSHELRTPLNSILILAQLLSENKNNRLEEKEVEYAKNIHNSGTSLLILINEILDLSKIEAGKMELDIDALPLESIHNIISSTFSEVARAKDITFDIKIDPKLTNTVIMTDKERVEQILKNLLSNAFKFTAKKGKVAFSIDKLSHNSPSKDSQLKKLPEMVALSVSDTGIGISKEKLDLVFQAFQQADGSTKRKYGGTGLGLSISRELAFALGGEIKVTSEEGKGSTFTLYLPLAFDPKLSISTDKEIAIKEKSAPAFQHSELRAPSPINIPEVADDRRLIHDEDRVILILEDDEKFANVLLNFARERGYKGVVATQGNTGISLARHYKPLAILLDMDLPVMGGNEVLKQIKNDPELRHIPVQIISAYDNQREAITLGAFDYLRKPVSLGQLKHLFERIETFTNQKLKKLLIVEDSEVQNKAIRELIGNIGAQCFSAFDGEGALNLLQAESFDLIILDLGLPDISGFELMEKIKSNTRLNKIPIVVYTGKDLKKEDNTRLTKLADTVVLKTANSQERLLDETILFLHLVESQLPKEKQNIIRKLHRTDDVLRNKRVLLVDDDIRNIYALTNALEDEGLTCLTAENGKIALETLKKNPEVDMVLMDLMMPEMDGYEATMAIRKLDEFKKLPIIALTAKAMKGDKEKCLEVGMSDYISKPLDVAQLLSLMRVWLYKG